MTARQRTVAPGATAPVGMAAVERQRVLARRRTALVTLGVLAIGTLGIAIVTGSLPILILSLIVDVMLAGYIAILLQIKQGRPGGGGVSPSRTGTTAR